jgi:hypothetical protein
VDFQGTAAYEVRLNSGLVYVDANLGSVLYADVQVAGGSSLGDDGEHDRYEGDNEDNEGGHDD